MLSVCRPKIAGYAAPAAMPPSSGARMNSQSWTIASPPANRAGPMERAGLAEVPVAGIATKWIAVSVRPIASGASAGCSKRSSVTARMTVTKVAVMSTSRRNAAHQA